jgi:hypothetical protein
MGQPGSAAFPPALVHLMHPAPMASREPSTSGICFSTGMCSRTLPTVRISRGAREWALQCACWPSGSAPGSRVVHCGMLRDYDNFLRTTDPVEFGYYVPFLNAQVAAPCARAFAPLCRSCSSPGWGLGRHKNDIHVGNAVLQSGLACEMHLINDVSAAPHPHRGLALSFGKKLPERGPLLWLYALRRLGYGLLQDRARPFDGQLQGSHSPTLGPRSTAHRRGPQVLLYNGQLDLIVGVPLTESMLPTIPWCVVHLVARGIHLSV